MVVPGTREGLGHWCFTGTEIQFGTIKESWRWMAVILQYANAHAAEMHTQMWFRWSIVYYRYFTTIKISFKNHFLVYRLDRETWKTVSVTAILLNIPEPNLRLDWQGSTYIYKCMYLCMYFFLTK